MRGRPSRCWWLPFILLPFCYGQPKDGTSSTHPSTSYTALVEQGQKLRRGGEFASAAAVFAKAAKAAKGEDKPLLEGKALLYEASCEVLLFRYRSAFQTLSAAESLAQQARDDTLSGQVAINRATLYYQLGDFKAAELAAQISVQKLKYSPRQDHYALALDNLAGIEFGENQITAARQHFREALALAQAKQLSTIEAKIADNFGIWLVLNNNLAEAETLLRRAFSIWQKAGQPADLIVSHEHLAELEQKKGPPFLSSALDHINIVLAQSRGSAISNPLYYPLHVRGLIRQGQGNTSAALADFRRSADQADLWRQSALPGDTTNTRTVAQLTAVYRDYVELAASVAVSGNNHVLAREAFSVLARNRAATLRDQLRRVNRSKFLDSPEYLSLLQQLQNAQADVTLSDGKGKSEAARKNLDRIRTQLNDLENRLGLDKDFVVAFTENNRKRNLLNEIQSGLGGRAALLSFTLGSAQSYLWTVTSTNLTLHQLPGQKTVEEQVRQFRAAVHTPAKRTALPAAGQALSKTLFSQIPARVLEKSEWLLAPDGELLDAMPFAALPIYKDGGTYHPLLAEHSLRVLPGAMLPAAKGAAIPAQPPTFLGVGDPIYNRADSRVDRKSAPAAPPKSSRYSTLARLVASRNELKMSAEACGLPRTDLLTGPEATGVRIRQAAAAEKPRIVHFAVHVLSPEGKPAEAALALSLNGTGIPEFLTAEVVSTLRTPGALVVLSGCASQQGDIIPGSGLVGLSRSWLLAGAEAVVVSAWPTPDVSGQFFSNFYTHYRQSEGAVYQRAAEALRQTQLDMSRSGGFRSNPDFWAAYSIVSKE